MKNIFKLTHSYSEDEVCVIKTTLSEEDLVKLIKIWQVKAFYILDTFDFFPEEMGEILKEGNCQEYDLEEEDDFVEIDLYEVWEAYDIIVKEDDIVMNENITDKSTKVFLEILLGELE